MDQKSLLEMQRDGLYYTFFNPHFWWTAGLCVHVYAFSASSCSRARRNWLRRSFSPTRTSNAILFLGGS